MNYLQLNFNVTGQHTGEMLLAFLSRLGFETFEEHDKGLSAFIPEEKYDEKAVNDTLKKDVFSGIDFEKHLLSEQNWNKIWEQNYQPVVIAERCIVKAPFHKIDKKYDFELLIEPQMSFGTAHHETTALMIELMLDIDFSGSSVLDMGSGTGILAILASKKGATDVVAIDNNIWAYRNSLHNLQLNNIVNIKVLEGDITTVPLKKYDFLLANINRNVLLEDIPQYISVLTEQGKILLSGFFDADYDIIHKSVSNFGFNEKRKLKRNDWVAVEFSK